MIKKLYRIAFVHTRSSRGRQNRSCLDPTKILALQDFLLSPKKISVKISFKYITVSVKTDQEAARPIVA